MTDWRTRAACVGADTAVFYPERVHGRGRDGRMTGADYTQARRICRRCDVVADCLAYALQIEGAAKERDRHGMWGAATPDERNRMRRRVAA